MEVLRCHSCGAILREGSLKYVIEIKSFADFDGYLEAYHGDLEERINEFIDAMEELELGNLEEDICQDVIYILCKRCRDNFVNDPFHTERPTSETEERKSTIH